VATRRAEAGAEAGRKGWTPKQGEEKEGGGRMEKGETKESCSVKSTQRVLLCAKNFRRSLAVA